jgi:hypothetical protein
MRSGTYALARLPRFWLNVFSESKAAVLESINEEIVECRYGTGCHHVLLWGGWPANLRLLTTQIIQGMPLTVFCSSLMGRELNCGAEL